MLLGSINHVSITVSDLSKAMEFFEPFLEFLGYHIGEVIRSDAEAPHGQMPKRHSLWQKSDSSWVRLPFGDGNDACTPMYADTSVGGDLTMVAEFNANRPKDASRAVVFWSASKKYVTEAFWRTRIFEKSKRPVAIGGTVAKPRRSIAREIEELYPEY